MGKELTGFEQFLQLVKDEHERQNREANDLEKRLSTIEKDLERLKDMIEKITRLPFVIKAIQDLGEPKEEREFPKTFQEVLNILKTDAKSDHVDFLYLLWIGITNNQDVISQRATIQELATLKCMLITKAINMVDNSNGPLVHHLGFNLGSGNTYNGYVYHSCWRSMPSTLIFKSTEGADHALKYFKEDWKQMYVSSK